MRKAPWLSVACRLQACASVALLCPLLPALCLLHSLPQLTASSLRFACRATWNESVSLTCNESKHGDRRTRGLEGLVHERARGHARQAKLQHPHSKYAACACDTWVK